MTEALKNMNKKYLIIIGSVFVVLFLIIIIVALSRACSKPGSDYTKVENKLVSAATKYLKKYPDAKPEVSKSVTIKAETLSDEKYMKPLSSYLKDTSCEAEVRVYNNNGNYLLIPDVTCAEYKTKHLADKIKKDNLISTTANVNETNQQQKVNTSTVSNDYISGLYEENGVYVFKGKTPNNYIQIGSIKMRIIDIDENGIIRALKTTAEKKNVRWDTKYNVDIKGSKGINDYKNSSILEILNNDYSKFKKDNKLHLAPMNVCITKRNNNTLSKDRNQDCSNRLEGQYISLVNSGDFARASLDENCNSIINASCTNYNYLSSIIIQTWTTNAFGDDSYEAIAINSGIAQKFEAREALNYNWVIAINGDEKYVKGDGTEKNPYIVGKVSKK